jgi:hypothetical protein
MSPVEPAHETVLILCRATPADSKKYGDTVCVAGITQGGEFRRIYPVPFRQFERGGGIPFRKKEWIDVRLLPAEARDKRIESRRIDMASVRVLRKASDGEIRSVLDPVVVPNIAALKGAGASLGVVRPKIIKYELEILDTDLFTGQRLLATDDRPPRKQGKVRLGQESYYTFVCAKREGCTCADSPHRMQLLDWEVNELYRHVVEGSTNQAEIRWKMREKMLDWMINERDIYFVMGTHHVFHSWMVVAILYLKGEAPPPPDAN